MNPPGDIMVYWYTCMTIMVFALGACIGSFLNVCIYRIPREESIVHPRSHCPACNTLIPWYWNIPLLSWILLRGKCRFCKAPITPRYLIVETITAVLFVLIWLKLDWIGNPLLGLTPMHNAGLIPVYWLVMSGLILGTFVDFEHLIIPDRVTLGGILAGLVLSPLVPALHGVTGPLESFLKALLGAAAGWGLLWGISWFGRLLFRKEAMGFGDVKLIGAIGAFLGWRAVLFTVAVSSLIGSIVGLVLVFTGRKAMQSRIPYGPYLALAAILWILWGTQWWDAYIRFMMPEPELPAGPVQWTIPYNP